MGTEGSEFSGHLQLYSKFKVNLDYTGPHLQKEKQCSSDDDQIPRVTCEGRCERSMGVETGTQSALSLWLWAPSSPIESIQKTQEIEHPKINK